MVPMDSQAISPSLPLTKSERPVWRYRVIDSTLGYPICGACVWVALYHRWIPSSWVEVSTGVAEAFCTCGNLA